MLFVLCLLELLFGRILPCSIGITLCVVTVKSYPLKSQLIILFLLGIIQDLGNQRPLAFCSLLYLTYGVIIWWLTQQLERKSTYWLIIYALVMQLFHSLLYQGAISYLALMIQAVLLLLTQFIKKNYHYKDNIYLNPPN